MRDAVDREMMSIYSMPTLEEMKGIVREDGFLGAPGRAKDDRVVAAALATAAFADQIQPGLIANRITRSAATPDAAPAADQLGVQKRVVGYLRAIGFEEKRAA